MKKLLKANNVYLSKTERLFYCDCKIKIPTKYDAEIIDQCFEAMSEIDLKYNSYQQDSYIDQINKNNGNWVKVDQQLIDLIQIIKKISSITSGAYDITSMPLIRLWGFYNKENDSIPIFEDIEKMKQNIDYNEIQISGDLIKINKGQEIITGSFIKAFAVDKAIEILKENGVEDALINAGGSTIKVLNNAEHPTWKIKIPDAETSVYNEESEVLISNECFSLSGRNENCITIGNQKFGHILNAKTGYPSQTLQVGVICEQAFLSDVLSTALFAVEPNEFPNVVQELQENFEFEFYRIENNGLKIKSTCF
ncbi:FAD:protein FMN transferase [Chryseobacterium sp. MYb264]|uniref:FAD:protein FMN transferase n=1 Tax=Chryseobacterium sp. MYb264 TaxID=2745153 RepID=UPI002E0E5174|nr:FAD:protein FMN transferase [Chryseobacterium sp. MYb264]